MDRKIIAAAHSSSSAWLTFLQSITLRFIWHTIPPYHSKYNPIERVWGVLENHWNGELLDSREKIIMLAESMTWNSNHPIVQEIPGTYQTGITLNKKEMAIYESQLERHPELGKWFVRIRPSTLHTQDISSEIHGNH